MSRYVRIYYGQYEEFCTKSHKPQKVKGLTDTLLKHGYRVHLIPVDFVNCCIIEVLGVEVFRCNIRNLCFNVPQEDDIVCQRAVAAVKDASKRLRRANSHFWMHSVFKQIICRTEYLPKPTWPFEIGIKPMTPVEECIECCRILVTKKKPPGEEVKEEEIDITCTVNDYDDQIDVAPELKAAKDAREAREADDIGEPAYDTEMNAEQYEEFYEGESNSEKENEDKRSDETKRDEAQVDFELLSQKLADVKEESKNEDGKRLVNINTETIEESNKDDATSIVEKESIQKK